jgi:hypothetical protein
MNHHVEPRQPAVKHVNLLMIYLIMVRYIMLVHYTVVDRML